MTDVGELIPIVVIKEILEQKKELESILSKLLRRSIECEGFGC